MKFINRILNIIQANLKICLFFLIISAGLNVISSIINVYGGCFAAPLISSQLSFVFAIYAITNIVGAKYGRLFNMHTIRWYILREKDRENEYSTICLKHIAVTLPVSVIWSAFNLLFIIIKLVAV